MAAVSGRTVGTISFFLTSLILYAILMMQQTTDSKWTKKFLVSRRNVEEVDEEVDKQLTCKPVRSVVYVKTHKTASSTVQKLLTRFASFQTSSFPNPYFGGYPAPFQSKFLNLRKQKGKENARTVLGLTGHFRYNPTEIHNTAKGAGKYVSIIRNPLRQFESSFNFYYGRFKKFSPRFNKISCFGEPYLQVLGHMGENMTAYLEKAVHSLDNSLAWFFRSQNYQSYDLGMDSNLQKTPAILKYVKKLDSDFDLIMIADYFFESLVLLKDTLCMEWEDVLPAFAQKGKYAKHSFTEREISLVKQLNKQDFLLFDYFNRTFWDKINAYGRERMANDVKTLRSLIKTSNPRDKNVANPESEEVLIIRQKRRNKNLNKTDVKFPRITQDEHVERLKTRIVQECGSSVICTNKDKVHEISKAMVDYNGWCPH